MTENSDISECLVRAATTDDDGPCGKIISAATLAAPTAERLPHARRLFEDASALSAEGYVRIVAGDASNRILGFCDFDPARAHIRYLFVAPEHQGKRIGQQLVAAVQVACNGATVTLNCFAVNDRALTWYLNHGFNIVGGGFTEFAGQPVVEISLCKDGAAN